MDSLNSKEEQFGVIAYKNENDDYIVLFEGTRDKLMDNIQMISEISEKECQIHIVDRDDYLNCKENIKELKELLD